MRREKILRAAIPRWDKSRPIRESDFLPPEERKIFYNKLRQAEKQKRAYGAGRDGESAF